MNSKERVLAAAERRRTDRPPCGLRCTPEGWEALRNHLGLGTNDEVMDELGIDLRWVGVPFIGPQERSAVFMTSEGTDFWGCHIRKIANPFNTYFEFFDPPLSGARSVADVEAHSWPSLDWWDYSATREAIDQANSAEPRAIIFHAGGAFETPWYIRGLDTFLMDLYDAPEIAAGICERVEEYYRKRALLVIEVAGGGIDIIGSGGDVGSQRGMILNPAVWRERIKPYSAGLITPFKEMDLKTFYHGCGSMVPVIGDLIDLGLDILDPIQVNTAGMKPEELFPQFGDRLSFHGAIDENELLPNATPEEVYRETVRTIDILGENGGYIVAPTHAIQGDTPPENVVAMLRAARDYRWHGGAR